MKKQVTTSGIALERATAYILLNDQRRLESVVPLLVPQMFQEAATWKFLVAGRALAARGAYSKNTLCAEVEQAGVKDARDHYNLLAGAYTSSSTFDTHYPLWLEAGRRRFIQAAEGELEEDLAMDTVGLISGKKQILEAAQGLGMIHTGDSMVDCVSRAVKIMESMRASGGSGIVRTGFQILDKYLLGLMPKTLTVIGARPSRGKTSLGCQLALQSQGPDFPVLFISAEMPSENVALKIAGMHKGVNTSQFSAPHLLGEPEYQAAKRAALDSGKLNIKILHKTDLSVIEAAILSLEPAPKLVVFDYLQILPTPKRYEGMRADYLSETVRSFSRLADKVGAAFLLLSQVGRSGERGGASNADLKGSGGIEEAADAIVLIERNDDHDGGADALKRTLRLTKNRYGWGDDVECPVLFDPRTQTFSDWDMVKAQRIAKSLGL